MAAIGLPQPPWHLDCLTQNCTELAWLLVETTDLFMMSVLYSTPEDANLLSRTGDVVCIVKAFG